jgi:hypothetical protein
MKVSTTSFGVLGGLAAMILTSIAVGVMDGCGAQQTPFGDDSGVTGPSGSSGGSSGASTGGLGTANPDGSSSIIITLPDGATQVVEAGGSSSGPITPMPIGKITAPDCNGCKFPDLNAPPCTGAPPIKVVYPNDTVLLPPNMNVISVQWTPFGSQFIRFEVDFTSSPNTDWRVVTACSNQTTDMQAGGAPSGGCELTVDPVSWGRLVQANRGVGPVAITVRGTTNGTCASTSNAVNVSWADEDLLGTYYYWKSTVTGGGGMGGVGGQIWMKVFGDLGMMEQDVTSAVTTASGTLMATCNGCHALSRDGTRMVVYSDDADSDDEYSDIGGSLLDMTPLNTNGTPAELGVGVSGSRTGGQPPGFTTLHPNATSYISSNGIPLTDAGTPPGGGFAGQSTSSGYSTAIPMNAWSLWDGMGNLTGPVAVASSTRPTMPDWSIDGKNVIYVQPHDIATWDPNGGLGFSGSRNDDDHIFGGSLYTQPYNGNGMFGTPTVFLMSGGENNYYPSFSPDADNMKPPSYVLFNRVAAQVGGTACANGFCPNDSFSNPAARLWLMKNMASATPLDLEKANGSPAASPQPLSNSYPRWAPFVQTYKGNPILWFTFSSTRDYGVRVLNHKSGMYQCYPADAAETPMGAHNQGFAAACQQPQLWMAPIFFTEAQGNKDPSGVAFWIPYQDITQHNHTAQWTWKPNPPPPPPPDGGPPPCACSMTYGPCGAKNACGCCNASDKCSGSSVCISIAN